MRSLDIVGMVVSARRSHALWDYVVRHNVGAIDESRENRRSSGATPTRTLVCHLAIGAFAGDPESRIEIHKSSDPSHEFARHK
jgi:hypothetical protein